MSESINVLDVPMDPSRNDIEATTVRDYLKGLLAAIWKEGESFNGKRPFGNSGWEYDLYRPLLQAGLVKGEIDPEEGDIISVDEQAADKLIAAAIQSLQ